jgi:hypothetical protein
MATDPVSTNMILQPAGFRRYLTPMVLIACLFFLCGAKAKPDNNPFPIRISEDGRHFEDQNGRPFFVHGDSAWSLIAQLNLKETEFYLDYRRAQGFNAILVNLIERKFAKNPPQNASSDPPFLIPGDFSTPHEAYFVHADAVIRMAAARGMLVFLVPAYLGWKGGDEGWFREIRAAGRENLKDYGRYVGSRYKTFQNIVWVVGGDYTPPQRYRWSIDALAEGIREGGATQLMTAHCGQESPYSALGNPAWLDFNNVYSQVDNLYDVTIREYGRKPVKPFIMIESVYEGEHHSTPDRIRRQAYWSILTGAAGHFYGNNPAWNFDSPTKVYPSAQPWRDALDSRGAGDMSRLWKFFQSVRWYALNPDTEHRFLVAGSGRAGSAGYSAAAVTGDGKMAVVYVAAGAPGEALIHLKKSMLPCEGLWVDPADGMGIKIDTIHAAREGKQNVTTPGTNSSGATDWILYLRAK